MNFTCPQCHHDNWIACNCAYELITHFVCDCGRLVALVDGEWRLANAPADMIALLDLTQVATGVATPPSGAATSHRAPTPPPIPPPRLDTDRQQLAGVGDTYDPEAVEDLALLAHKFEEEAKLALATAHRDDDIPHNPYIGQALLMPMWKPEPEQPKRARRAAPRRSVSSIATVAGVVLFAGAAAAYFAVPRARTPRHAMQAPAVPTLVTHNARAQLTAIAQKPVVPAVQPVQAVPVKTQTVPPAAKTPHFAQKTPVAPATVKAPAKPLHVATRTPKPETVAPTPVAKKTAAPTLIATNTTPPPVKNENTAVTPHKVVTPAAPKHVAKAKADPTESVLAAASKTQPKKVWDEVECRLADAPPPQCARWVSVKKATKKVATVNPDLPKYLSKSAINAGLARVKASVMGCEVRGLGRGLVVLRLKVRANGTIEQVGVTTTPTTALGQCVAERVTPARFAKTQNGATFSYVYSFR